MSTMFYVFLGLIIFVAFLLIVVIMVQNPKGGGLSSSFGGGGGGQQMGGVQKTTDFLDKATWGLATILLVLILLSNISIFGGNREGASQVFDEDAIDTPAIPSNDGLTTPADDSNGG